MTGKTEKIKKVANEFFCLGKLTFNFFFTYYEMYKGGEIMCCFCTRFNRCNNSCQRGDNFCHRDNCRRFDNCCHRIDPCFRGDFENFNGNFQSYPQNFNCQETVV